MMERIIKINENDTVAVATTQLACGEWVRIGTELLQVKETIPAGHKIALCDIKEGIAVVKYGSSIGYATQDIERGTWVHTHNLRTGLEDVVEYQYKPQLPPEVKKKEAYFYGYDRGNNKFGVRNEIWIVPTVGCVNNVALAIAEQAKQFKTGSIDAIVAFPHPYGCSQMGDDQEYTRKFLANLIQHPNAGGVLVLGLGCENSNVTEIKKQMGSYDTERVKFLVCQEYEDEIEAGVDSVKSLIQTAAVDERSRVSASHLIVGLKCGGSDGFSGITANPLVGRFSDHLIAAGGTTILTEVPEMFGAETILMNRCRDAFVFEQTVDLINNFKKYFTTHGQTIYENPSPGNKAGGISTLEDKSLGCTQKAGTTIVNGVIAYADTVKEKGLNLLNAPGNDLVAASALAVAGAQIVLFTTGRGTPFASPVPTVKIASNSKLAGQKRRWIDFDAGVLVDGTSMEDVEEQFFDYVLQVASGKFVRSEEAGFHDMAIFKQGVTL